MSLKKYIDNIKPNFEPDGKLHAFRSIFDGFETFLYVPNTTAKMGVNIHDAIDSKRIMSMVVIALMPAMLFGMYNVGYQNYAAAGTLASASFLEVFFYGFFAVLPKILVSYIVGLGIEFAWAQWKGEEIQEGYLVSGILIPLIVPIGCPLDAGIGMCLLGHLLQGDLWWYRNEYFQSCHRRTYVPLLCLSVEDDGRPGMGGPELHLRTGQ